jgi:hypothetical protein
MVRASAIVEVEVAARCNPSVALGPVSLLSPSYASFLSLLAGIDNGISRD